MMASSAQAIELGANPNAPTIKTLLSALQAQEIYQMKPEPLKPSTMTMQRGQSQSRVLGERYGVSPKAIRDIWNKRTWSHATVDASISNEVLSCASLPTSTIDNDCVEV